MKVVGDHVFAVGRSVVWKALLDPGVLSRTLPGCEELVGDGDHRFKGVLNTRVGPVQGRFDGTVELFDLDPENGYRLKLVGQGSAGFVDGEGTLALEDADEGTRLRYDLDINVGGRIAGLGQRLLDSSAKVMTRQGLEGLGKQLDALAEGGGAEVAEPAAEPESQARFAGRFAFGVLNEMIPRPVQIVVGIAAAIGLFVLFRSCG